MNVMEAVQARHSVRSFLDRPIDPATLAELQALVAQYNAESGLRMQLMADDPAPFGGLLSKIGWLSGVRSYLALVGPDDAALDEKCGYWGEKLVLEAQARGVNSCWVGGSYKPGKCSAEVRPGERLALVVALGYGRSQGKPHKSKGYAEVTVNGEGAPDWFRRGVDCALLAPTAINQQKFKFELMDGDRVRATTDRGPFSNVDLGIARLHFELGAGKGDWQWN